MSIPANNFKQLLTFWNYNFIYPFAIFLRHFKANSRKHVILLKNTSICIAIRKEISKTQYNIITTLNKIFNNSLISTNSQPCVIVPNCLKMPFSIFATNQESRSNYVSPLLKYPQKLPVTLRMHSKILGITYKALHNLGPAYFCT